MHSKAEAVADFTLSLCSQKNKETMKPPFLKIFKIMAELLTVWWEQETMIDSVKRWFRRIVLLINFNDVLWQGWKDACVQMVQCSASVVPPLPLHFNTSTKTLEKWLFLLPNAAHSHIQLCGKAHKFKCNVCCVCPWCKARVCVLSQCHTGHLLECTGTAEREYMRTFEIVDKQLMVCISISSLLHNTTPPFVCASVWLMFIPSGPVTLCSCVNNGITHWAPLLPDTDKDTLCRATLIVPSLFCRWIAT